jgi:hypothetical protein
VISTRTDQKMARSSSIHRWACRATSTTAGSGRSNRSTRSKAGSGWATRREDQAMPKRIPNLPLFLLFGAIDRREEIGRWLSIIFHHEAGAHDWRFAKQVLRHRIPVFARRTWARFMPAETETDTKLTQSRFRRRADDQAADRGPAIPEHHFLRIITPKPRDRQNAGKLPVREISRIEGAGNSEKAWTGVTGFAFGGDQRTRGPVHIRIHIGVSDQSRLPQLMHKRSDASATDSNARRITWREYNKTEPHRHSRPPQRPPDLSRPNR